MKVFVALLAVVALATANPLPLVQIIVNVDAPASGDVAEDIVMPPIERPTPVPWPVEPVELPPPIIPDPIIVPDPIVLPQPVIPVPVPEAVALPQPEVPMPVPEVIALPNPVIPEPIVTEPVVMPDEIVVAAAIPTH